MDHLLVVAPQADIKIISGTLSMDNASRPAHHKVQSKYSDVLGKQ